MSLFFYFVQLNVFSKLTFLTLKLLWFYIFNVLACLKYFIFFLHETFFLNVHSDDKAKKWAVVTKGTVDVSLWWDTHK